MLDWLIVGGGALGTALSLALTVRDGVQRDRLRVLDPHERALALWHKHTANVGMRYLRSPGVHHLHYDPFSHRVFAQTRRGEPLLHSIPRFERPSLRFFNGYSDYLLERYDLAALRWCGRATGLTRARDGWRVATGDGAIMARRVVLAVSANETPHYPAWARDVRGIEHIFAPDFQQDAIADGEAVIVVGGGISAGQAALSLAGRCAVTLVMRHPRRVHHFDSDPCWVTNICLKDFHALDDHDARRAVIQSARNRGSMPPDVAGDLAAAIADGQLNLREAHISRAESTAGGVRVTFSDGATAEAARVICCTGFETARPGGDWLTAAIHAEGLPTAACGYPVIGRDLRWADGLYVVGALAELEIGPVARNLIGGRLAAERLKHIVRASPAC